MENTTLTLKEIKMIIKDFLIKAYDINEMPMVTLNGRLGRRTLGQYFYAGNKKGTIEIAKNLKEVEKAVGVVLHEAVHYALHKMKGDFKDGTLAFESNLAKYNLPTNYRSEFFERRFGASLRSFKEEYFVEDMIKHYSKMILKERNPQYDELMVANEVVNPAKEVVNVKLEKTRISSLLHEYKMSVVPKNDKRYGVLTNTVDAIDNTRAKDKDTIIQIYKDFLNAYYNDDIFTPDPRISGIVILINTKVGN